jgi:hypothetical protein
VPNCRSSCHFPKVWQEERKGEEMTDLRWKCVDESESKEQDKDRYGCDKKNFDLRREGHKMFKQFFIKKSNQIIS